MLDKIAGHLASTKALPHTVWMAVSIFELLCGVALVAPPAVKIRSSLTSVAATCLAVEGVLFVVLHATYGEYSPMFFSLVSAVLAAGKRRK